LAVGGGLVLIGALFGLHGLFNVVGVGLQAVFLVFFIRHVWFAASALHSATADLDAPVLPSEFVPRLTVMVACKNEETVVEGLVSSLLTLDYDPDRLQLIVVDDGSDDQTPALLDRAAEVESRLTVIHRPPGSSGGKSGALNSGLRQATGELLVVFDADHKPRPDVLRRLARHFQDPRVAGVQGRCHITNPNDSPISKLIALDYLAGYLVNEYGRQSVFQLPAYGGANCAVRASVLREMGGWNVNTVTEDTDLTMRLILTGHRVRYDLTAVDEEEGVTTLERFWRQRYRWARGHQQVWREYRRAVWTSPRLTFRDKFETTLFLLAFHVPVLTGAGTIVLLAWLSGVRPPVGFLDLYVFWILLYLGPLLELGAGLLIARAPRREAGGVVFFLPMFFVSIALCSKAWIDGIIGRPYTWVKTRRAAEA
jgi:cellulose synthase/poly-beta-1,6-N-acetylglucosamine synthase-like glycosyltransferase